MPAPSKRTDRIELGQEPIWEMQFEETLTQYRAFCLYRDLMDTRSLARVGQLWGKIRQGAAPGDEEAKPAKTNSLARLQEWSARNRWVERADAYTLYVEGKLREAREADIGRMARTEASLGRAMVGAALTRMLGGEIDGERVEPLKVQELTAGEVALLAREGVRISRISTSRPTELIRGVLVITTAEFVQVTGDLADIALPYIPDELKPAYADDIRAYSAGERRMLNAAG